jgi:hypothetical protein
MTSWSTERTYAGGWAAWRRWAESNNRPERPASVVDLLDFFAHEQTHGHATASLRVYRSSILHHHIAAGIPSSTAHESIRLFFRGLDSPTPPRVRAALLHPELSLQDRTLLLLVHVAGIELPHPHRLRWKSVQPHALGATLSTRHAAPRRHVRVFWNYADPGLCVATHLLLLGVGARPSDRVFPRHALPDTSRKLVRLGLDLDTLLRV